MINGFQKKDNNECVNYLLFFLINVILLYKNDAVRFVIFLTQVDDITLFRGIA